MTIATIQFLVILTGQIVTLYFIMRLVERIDATEKRNQIRFQKYMDNIVALTPTIVKPAPNEAVEVKDDGNILDENVPWNIPKDVKITVEGGDTLAPPEFEVN